MKLQVLRAGAFALLFGATVAQAQVGGVKITPVGATAEDLITITVYPDQTCPLAAPDPANPDRTVDPNKSLADATILRLHSGVTVLGNAWQAVVGAGPADNNDILAGFTQQPDGSWTKSFVPRDYYTGAGANPISGLNFVLNGGPTGSNWDKEGKDFNPANGTCADYSAAFPLSGEITNLPAFYQKREITKLMKPVFPNPVNGNGTLGFTMLKQERATIKVYNTIGTEVATILDETRVAGEHTVNFNTANLSTGVYHIKLQTGNKIDSQKILIVQ